MNFKILRFNESNRTMVIDWLNGMVLNHYIPSEIIENPDVSKERVVELIERLRPEPPQPIEIPNRLREVYEETNQSVYDGGGEDDII